MDLSVINKKYIDDINFHRKQCSKNKALLSFKYDDINLKTNVIQITIILLSTGITFIETIKSYYDLNSNFYNTIIIIFSTLIALIMAIFRFLKYDEKRENIKKAIEDHVFIINKFRKTFNQLENAKLKGNNNDDEMMKILNNYESEIFDNYISIRENFDTIFSFKESIYYKNKYKELFLELERTNGEIELINKFRNKIRNVDYIYPSFLKRIFCCKKKKLKYNAFLEKTSTWETENHEDKKTKNKLFEKGKHYYKIKMNHIVKDIPELKHNFMAEILELSRRMEELLVGAKHETYFYKLRNPQYEAPDDNISINSEDFKDDTNYMRNEMFRTEACAPTEPQPQPQPYLVEELVPESNAVVREYNL
jgi:hypothetical protein